MCFAIGESTRNVKKNVLAYCIFSPEERARNITDTGRGRWRFKRGVYVIPVWPILLGYLNMISVIYTGGLIFIRRIALYEN